MISRTLRYLLGLALLLTICALFIQSQSASAANASVRINGGCSPAQRLLKQCGVTPTAITPTSTPMPTEKVKPTDDGEKNTPKSTDDGGKGTKVTGDGKVTVTPSPTPSPTDSAG